MKFSKEYLIVILFLIHPFSVLAISNIPDHNISDSIHNESIVPSFNYDWQNNSNWHLGSDKSTPQLNLNYLEEFSEDKNCVYQWAKITYKDTTSSEVAFRFTCSFDNGTGVDFVNNKVKDWRELDHIEPTLTTDTPLSSAIGSGDFCHSERVFEGFSLYNGSSKELNFIKYNHGSNYEIIPDQDEIAHINFQFSPIRIGIPTISTEDYTSLNGQVTKKSIIHLEINLNATIGTQEENTTIPVNLNFQINHTIDYTKYKYGIDIDWSKSKAFPTQGELNTGDEYCLISKDDLQFTIYEPEQISYHTFKTNSENDTAYFSRNNVTLSQFEFTKQYRIKNNAYYNQTGRKYFRDAGNDTFDGRPHSKVYVMYDGFKYNSSTGLEFDPTFSVFIISESETSILVFVIIIGAISFIGIGGYLLYRRRNKVI
ncbi:MAG: hypothetical protein GF317_15365 [Candidatus Lokiarchaeota archaeon]|nr:hypothetical protein [Candidatus Lokiarchaeota archaeon]MBD3200944.1 hypothetical protein [Candidatus Lokiarchaeota archaeon]